MLWRAHEMDDGRAHWIGDDGPWIAGANDRSLLDFMPSLTAWMRLMRQGMAFEAEIDSSLLALLDATV